MDAAGTDGQSCQFHVSDTSDKSFGRAVENTLSKTGQMVADRKEYRVWVGKRITGMGSFLP